MPGLNILKIPRLVKDVFLIVLDTSSSETAMPTLMESRSCWAVVSLWWS